VLVRRTALTTPQLAATVHLAAALAVDERPDGAWHAEWATVRTLLRRTAAAGSHVTELLDGLRVHPGRMAATLAGAGGVHSEQEAMAALADHPAADDYRGETDRLVDDALTRAQALELKGTA
jgi:3-carboxy-cis,cis-muconate cycloisomerase